MRAAALGFSASISIIEGRNAASRTPGSPVELLCARTRSPWINGPGWRLYVEVSIRSE